MKGFVSIISVFVIGSMATPSQNRGLKDMRNSNFAVEYMKTHQSSSYRKANFYPVISLFTISERYENFIGKEIFIRGTLRIQGSKDAPEFYLEEDNLKIQITPWAPLSAVLLPPRKGESKSIPMFAFLNKEVLVYGNLQKTEKIKTTNGWLIPDAFKKGKVKDDEFYINLKEEVKIGNWIFRFLEVLEDSRCPLGVMCPWEGRVRVALEIEGEKGKDIIVLEERGLVQAEILSYKGKDFLFNVLPYPEVGKKEKREEYFIRIKEL